MSKQRKSFALDSRQIEILKTGARQYEIGESEYLRNILDSYQRVQFFSNTKDFVVKTKNARNLFLSEMNLSVLKSLSKGYNTLDKKRKPSKTLRGFSKRHELSQTTVLGVIKQLVDNSVLEEIKENGQVKYNWTYLGVIALPEYAPLSGDSKNLVSGSILSALNGMLGEYDDVIEFFSNELKISFHDADSLLRFFLTNYLGYFNFLREIIYPLVGVTDPLDTNYYRNQLLDYLIILINNSNKSWNDWQDNTELDLTRIYQKITEQKKVH